MRGPLSIDCKSRFAARSHDKDYIALCVAKSVYLQTIKSLLFDPIVLVARTTVIHVQTLLRTLELINLL